MTNRVLFTQKRYISETPPVTGNCIVKAFEDNLISQRIFTSVAGEQFVCLSIYVTFHAILDGLFLKYIQQMRKQQI